MRAQNEPGVRPCRLKRDHASYSLNTDDPTITQTKVDDEYQLCLKVGLLPSDILNSVSSARVLSGYTDTP